MQCILIISDLHAPYNHPDIIQFLKAIKRKFKPTQVILSGDEVDYHAISFHDHDPNLPSASDELQLAIEQLKPIYKMFPVATVLESNHGSLIYRKALHSGLPSAIIKSYNDVLQAPKGWKWCNDYTVSTPQGDVYFHHSRGKALKTAQTYGISHVCGHHHESFDIQYWSTPSKLLFAMTVGCLVDRKALAMAYNKTNLKRPIIGCAIILDGIPQLIPMVLNNKGRWIGKL